MRIALLKETKTPVDNRVALSPKQVADLNRGFPGHEVVVQSSDIRAFSDEDYRAAGCRVVENVDDCDILFGIKEAKIDTLIPGKRYFFFGHVAKKQEYNRPLLQALIHNRITFCDYEYLVDDKNVRVAAFGWWAGIVGVYYTLLGYGLKYNLYTLPKPGLRSTLDQLFEAMKNVNLPKVKLFITGAGRVSSGAQFFLDRIGAKKVSEEEYLSLENVDRLTYCFADVDRLVVRKDGGAFSWGDFTGNPQAYQSDFWRWAKATDILICAHYWEPAAPIYLSEEDLRRSDLRVKMIGDITCDIKGSVKSTVRSSTHADPFYDYNPETGKEDPAFSSPRNISVMAVDTCPNALAMDTSAYFGEMLTKNVFEPLLKGEHSDIIDRSMILEEGRLTKRFDYLRDFSEGK